MYPCYPKQATRVWGSEITTVTFMSYTFEAASFASQASYQHLAVSSSPQANPLRCLQASTLLKLPSSQHRLRGYGKIWEAFPWNSLKKNWQHGLCCQLLHVFSFFSLKISLPSSQREGHPHGAIIAATITCGCHGAAAAFLNGTTTCHVVSNEKSWNSLQSIRLLC